MADNGTKNSLRFVSMAAVRTGPFLTFFETFQRSRNLTAENRTANAPVRMPFLACPVPGIAPGDGSLAKIGQLSASLLPSLFKPAFNLRYCLVFFTDPQGIEHSVRVPAESLYEAAIEAMAASGHSVLSETPLGPATRLTIRVKVP